MTESKFKRIIAAALALMLTAGIAAACGGKKSDDGGSNDGSAAATDTPKPTLMADIAETTEEPQDTIDWSVIDKLEIGTPYYFVNLSDFEGYQRGFDKFNEEHGNIAVQLDATGVGGAEFTAGEDLLMAINAGDVWNLQATAYFGFPYKQCIYRPYTKIDKFINWGDGFWDKEFHDKNFRWRGNYYSIAAPEQVDINYLTYNPKDFAQASLPTPRECYEANDWNFAKILEYGAIFKASTGREIVDISNLGMGFLWDATWFTHNQADDSLSPNFDNMQTRDYFSFFEEVRNSGYCWKNGMPDQNPILYGWPSHMLTTEKGKQAIIDGELEFVPFPAKNGIAKAKMQVWHFMVPRGAKNVQAAVLLGVYLCQGKIDGMYENYAEIGGDKEQWMRSIVPKNPEHYYLSFPGIGDPYHMFTWYETDKTAAQFVAEWDAMLAGQIELYNMTYLDGVVYVPDEDEEE